MWTVNVVYTVIVAVGNRIIIAHWILLSSHCHNQREAERYIQYMFMLMCRVCFWVALECWFVLDRNPTEGLCGEMLPAARSCPPPLTRSLFSPFLSPSSHLWLSTFVCIHDYCCTLFNTFSHPSDFQPSQDKVIIQPMTLLPSQLNYCFGDTSKYFLASVKCHFISTAWEATSQILTYWNLVRISLFVWERVRELIEGRYRETERGRLVWPLKAQSQIFLKIFLKKIRINNF